MFSWYEWCKRVFKAAVAGGAVTVLIQEYSQWELTGAVQLDPHQMDVLLATFEASQGSEWAITLFVSILFGVYRGLRNYVRNADADVYITPLLVWAFGRNK